MFVMHDLHNRPVNVGDRIVVAFRVGNSSELRAGTVVEIKGVEKFTGSRLDYMKVDWGILPDHSDSWITRICPYSQRIFLI